MTIEIKIPDIGVDEVEVIEILVQVGDIVKLEQSLILVEGDKASMEVPSPCDGIVSQIKVKVGDKIKTDSVIMFFKLDSASSILKNNDVGKKNFDSSVHINQSESSVKFIDHQLDQVKSSVHASPLIRKLAREKDINLSFITGSGPKNRILKEDIDTYLSKMMPTNKVLYDQNHSTALKNDLNKTVFLSKIQLISGKNLSQNWKNIPHVTHFDEIDVTDLDKFRTTYNLDMKKKNIKITLLSFIIKIVEKALEFFPIFNSSINMKENNIILKKDINIGIVVNTNNGLLIPILKNVKYKNIIEISSLLQDLSDKARQNKLTLSDLSGGTFTISNLGGLRGTYFTPIINSTEVAILGISKCTMKSIYNGSVFIPRLMLPLSFSYDHRVINGVDAANFINFVNEYVSDIRLLIM